MDLKATGVRYDQLMMELRNEDPAFLINFLRMPPDMFDELLSRVGPRITKMHIRHRESLEPGMKLDLTLRDLASGNKYASMKVSWRVPHSTISLVVREVCNELTNKKMKYWHVQTLLGVGALYLTSYMEGLVLFDLILYVPSTLFQLNKDGSS